MTIKELIIELEKYSPDQELEIYFEYDDDEGWDCCRYGRIISVSTQEDSEKIEIFGRANGYN